MGLRDRLKGRQLPQATVGIRIDWSEESYRLHELADIAEVQVANAREAEQSDDVIAERQKAADEARRKVDDLYEYLTVNALPAREMEELVSEHPPTPDQLKETENLSFNRDTFFPALLAACVDSDETVEDWAELLKAGQLTTIEVNSLISVSMELNDRSPSVVLGKGSTTTFS